MIILKRPNLLYNLVLILIRFCSGKFVVVGNTAQMFQQFRVWEIERDALWFVCREFSGRDIKDCQMTVHLFGKIDLHCTANFALKKSALNKISEILLFWRDI